MRDVHLVAIDTRALRLLGRTDELEARSVGHAIRTCAAIEQIDAAELRVLGDAVHRLQDVVHFLLVRLQHEGVVDRFVRSVDREFSIA